MKKLRQIIADVKVRIAEPSGDLLDMLWPLICYSPKMPLRLHQQQLLSEATQFTLRVNDEYFEHRELNFNGFVWGNGSHKILITHGWGSKAADFAELITTLRGINDVQIIAFDAPGNGSSEGELTSLILYALAVKAIVTNYGEPDIVIGHSFGGMVNATTLGEMQIKPSLLISLAPLIRLKENFEATMSAVGVPQSDQENFMADFKRQYITPVSYYNLDDRYCLDSELHHFLAYDEYDLTAPYSHIRKFLDEHTYITGKSYNGAGHERILRSPEVINDLVDLVKISVGPR